MKKILILSILLQLVVPQVAFAKKPKVNLGDLNIGELVLPTEVEKLPRKSGSIYYSKSVKNKVLIPTNFWGEVNTSGLHFVPQGTSLINGLSLAGGPTGSADISTVQVTRNSKGKFRTLRFDLQGGGDEDAHTFPLRPGDVIFVKKDHFYEDRTYYTTLISVATTILTGILLYRQVEDNN